MFDRELDYYGITPNDDIVTQMSLGKWGHLSKVSKSLKASLDKAQMKHDMFSLALHCSSVVGQRVLNFPNNDNFDVSVNQGHNLYNRRDLDDEEKTMFEEHLDRYFGLKIVGSDQPNRRGVSFKVGPK